MLAIIIIMAIFKAPTQRLKALNKHITHMISIEMKNVIHNFNYEQNSYNNPIFDAVSFVGNFHSVHDISF